MSKEQIGLLVAGVVVGVIVFFVFMSGMFGGRAYACGDGTEFTLTVAKDESSVTIRPTKNAAVFPVKTLEKVEGEVGSTFVGGSVVLFGKGTDLQLITAASSTVCKPVNQKEPLQWGA